MSVLLRPLRESDLEQCLCWRNDPEVVQFMGGEVGSTKESLQEWFARFSASDSKEYCWAIEAGGQYIGNCGLTVASKGQTADYGIMIGDKNAWGKGYGTAATREALRRGFEELGLHRIYLHTFPENLRGLRCYEKCGFRREGYEKQAYYKEGKWRDLVTMAILREEWEDKRPSTDCADNSDLLSGAGLQPAKEGAGFGDPALQDVIIRHYRTRDYPAVIALWEAAGLPPRASDAKEEVAKKLTRDPDLFLVARLGGSIVGTVIGGWDGRRGWVYRMAVAPNFQRRGIGHALMTALESRLREKGAIAINLIYNTDNTPAQAFYLKCGYQKRTEVSVMSKELTPPKETDDES